MKRACTRCLLLRCFLAAIVGIAGLALVAPDVFGLVSGVSTLTAALVFLAVLGAGAILRAAISAPQDRHGQGRE